VKLAVIGPLPVGEEAVYDVTMAVTMLNGALVALVSAPSVAVSV
jgi:hypothetical protein